MRVFGTAQSAQELGVFTNVQVLQPELQNPATTDGVGLELVTKKTLVELVRLHRAKLMALTYAAQFLVVYSAPSSETVASATEAVPLDHTRNHTDMIWHTDQVHREHGSVNIIEGESTIATGLAPKYLINGLAHSKTDTTELIWPQLGINKHVLRSNHAKMLYTDVGTLFLHEAWQSIDIGRKHEANIEALRVDFWHYIQAINSDPHLVWIGEVPAPYQGLNQAIFTARTGYHCKQFDSTHGTETTRRKRRLELRPSLKLRRNFDNQFAHLTTENQARPLDQAWFDNLSND